MSWVGGAVLLLVSLAEPLRAQSPAWTYVPNRVYDVAGEGFTDFETLVADAARADVLAIGEQHDDPSTHPLQLAILEGLARRKRAVIVSLEMFERDVQPLLDDHIGSRISESVFLEGARPWPRYATDYRPLVEFADSHAWPVVAGNVPRRIANDVSKRGLPAVEALSEADRAYVAADLQCPVGDDYYKRFQEEMKLHPPSPGQSEEEMRQATERFYLAQCAKDETMAESIALARARAVGPKPLVVHINGSFHSDFRYGVVARAMRRLPDATIKVVSVIPVDDLDAVDPASFDARADYLLFTQKPPEKPARAGDEEKHGPERVR